MAADDEVVEEVVEEAVEEAVEKAVEAADGATAGMSQADKALALLEQSLEYCFLDRTLPAKALTHSSFSNEKGESSNYERLEFLGDAVLGLVTSQWLYLRYRQRPEGDLAKLKSYLVSAPVLADFARSIDVGAKLRLGVGEERSGGRSKPSILADAMEAIFGAVYLDGGIEAARLLIERVLVRGLERRSRVSHRDAKTRLQEITQADGRGLPDYQLESQIGPDHDKQFTVECRLDGKVIGRATGRSKKTAEQGAAAQALEWLES